MLRISCVESKFNKFLMSFYKVNFASFCSFMTHNSSVLSWLKRNILSIKIAHQSADFQTFYCLRWNSPNPSCHVWNQLSVFRQTLYHSSVTWDITLLYFFIWKFTCFGQKEPIKVQISRFQLVAWNLIKFFMSILKRQVSLSLTFESPSQNPMTFFSWNICFGQKEPIKVQFLKLLRGVL